MVVWQSIEDTFPKPAVLEKKLHGFRVQVFQGVGACTYDSWRVLAVVDMGACQNHGPFLLNIRCRMIIGIQKGP